MAANERCVEKVYVSRLGINCDAIILGLFDETYTRAMWNIDMVVVQSMG